MDQLSGEAGERFSPNLTDMTEERLAQLRVLFPEAFGEDGIDFDELRAALGDELDDRRERYTFSWAGKAEAIRILRAPSSATLGACARPIDRLRRNAARLHRRRAFETLKLRSRLTPDKSR